MAGSVVWYRGRFFVVFFRGTSVSGIGKPSEMFLVIVFRALSHYPSFIFIEITSH